MMTETSFWELIWRGWLLPKPWLLYEFIKWYFGNLKSSGKWLLINKVVELFSYLQWWGLCSPCAGRSPWGLGEAHRAQEGGRAISAWAELWNEQDLGRQSICPSLKLGMSHENKTKLTAGLVYIQLQPLSLFLWHFLCILFYFYGFFKCWSSRTLPLTFQHLISQKTIPYLWQLHHVHLLEIEQNKSLPPLTYVHGKNKILSVRLLQFLFVVLTLY